MPTPAEKVYIALFDRRELSDSEGWLSKEGEKALHNALENMEWTHNGKPERNMAIFNMRFGFNNGCGMSLRDVGREFLISSERVRQVEAKMLRRLRHPRHALKSYLPPEGV